MSPCYAFTFVMLRFNIFVQFRIYRIHSFKISDFINVYYNVTLGKIQTNISNIDKIVSRFGNDWEKCMIYEFVPFENESIESSNVKSRHLKTWWFLAFLGSGTQFW